MDSKNPILEGLNRKGKGPKTKSIDGQTRLSGSLKVPEFKIWDLSVPPSLPVFFRASLTLSLKLSFNFSESPAVFKILESNEFGFDFKYSCKDTSVVPP